MTEQDIPQANSQQNPTLLDPSRPEALIGLRNQAIEAVLNPEGTLPVVTLQDRYERSRHARPDTGIDNHNYAVFAEDGTEIAKAVIPTPYGNKAEKTGAASVDIVEILADKQDTYKGKGYGKAIYKEILKSLPAGLELECDARGVSPDAIKMWQWLESLGLAERPAELGEPVLSYDELGKPHYKNLGYKTKLAELTEFAATR